jgi:hypothetical protein
MVPVCSRRALLRTGSATVLGSVFAGCQTTLSFGGGGREVPAAGMVRTWAPAAEALNGVHDDSPGYGVRFLRPSVVADARERTGAAVARYQPDEFATAVAPFELSYDDVGARLDVGGHAAVSRIDHDRAAVAETIADSPLERRHTHGGFDVVVDPEFQPTDQRRAFAFDGDTVVWTRGGFPTEPPAESVEHLVDVSTGDAKPYGADEHVDALLGAFGTADTASVYRTEPVRAGATDPEHGAFAGLLANTRETTFEPDAAVHALRYRFEDAAAADDADVSAFVDWLESDEMVSPVDTTDVTVDGRRITLEAAFRYDDMRTVRPTTDR